MEKFWVILTPGESEEPIFETENAAFLDAKKQASEHIGEKFYVLEAVAEVVGKVETEVKKLSW